MLDENRQKVNIIAYYTSRHLNEEIDGKIIKSVSYKKLGFENRSKTIEAIARKFGVKGSYFKNMEDSYDAIHDNHRKGWYQRALRPAQQKIIDSFKDTNEQELLQIVKSLIENETTNAISIIEQKINSGIEEEATNDDLENIHQFARRIRKGQPKFRKNLIKLYEGKCAVTNCSISEVLEAAHILRHSVSGINHTSNGILLRSDIHSLFDLNKIKINPFSYLIEVDMSLKNSNYWKYNKEKINMRVDGKYPGTSFLKIKYKG